MEKKIRHLEMIQKIINRMANNSFMLKGWTVTLIAGVFLLAPRDVNHFYCWLAYVPIVSFWILDSYYLQQEKLYRNLYEKVRKTKKSEIDFSLKAPISEFADANTCICRCIFSRTECWFYLPLAAVTTVIMVMTRN